LDESALISTTVLDTASDSATVVYSATARTNVPFRVVGFVESTQSTAGAWASAPSKIQGYGGLALSPDIKAALNASGSAPVYAARAWVNFNGTGTVAIRASGNVSSITDNGTGTYTVNFTTAMPDVNYAVSGIAASDSAGELFAVSSGAGPSYVPAVGSIQLGVRKASDSTASDAAYVNVAIFR
jgi:hypothetical protein